MTPTSNDQLMRHPLYSYARFIGRINGFSVGDLNRFILTLSAPMGFAPIDGAKAWLIPNAASDALCQTLLSRLHLGRRGIIDGANAYRHFLIYDNEQRYLVAYP